MIPVPEVHAWANNERPNFRDMNNYLESPLSFLLNPPMVRLRKTSSQTIATGAIVAVSWNTVDVETVSMWDSTAPTKITPSVPGWYIGNAGFSFATSTVGVRVMYVAKNASSTERSVAVSHDAYTEAGITVVSRGNVFVESFNGTTDYIEMYVQQTSGGNLDIISDAVERQPDFSLRWLCSL